MLLPNLARSSSSIAIAVLAVVLTLLAMDAAAFCIQTSYGLSPGKMSQSRFSDLLSTLRKNTAEHGDQMELFIVQNQEGYYGKICNEAPEKEAFNKHYLAAGGRWQCGTVCGDDALMGKYADATIMVLKIKWQENADQQDQKAACYEVCNWVK